MNNSQFFLKPTSNVSLMKKFLKKVKEREKSIKLTMGTIALERKVALSLRVGSSAAQQHTTKLSVRLAGIICNLQLLKLERQPRL
jgi:hypothetical protein